MTEQENLVTVVPPEADGEISSPRFGAPDLTPRSVRASLAFGLLPLIFAMIAFSAGLGGGFVLDDDLAIVRNPVVNGSVGPQEAFIRNFWGRPLHETPVTYRPLSVLSFRLDYSLFGPSPFAFHIVSLLFYLLTVEIGRRLSRQWLNDREACVAACLFAVLPFHAENVASLVGRADVLAFLFSLLSLYMLRRAPTGDLALLRQLAASAAAFLAALLCKESAACLPLIVAALIQFSPRNSDGSLKGLLRRHYPSLVLLGVLSAYMAVRLTIIPNTLSHVTIDDVLENASPWQRIVYGLGLAAEYVRLLVFPIDLCTGRKYAEVCRPDGMTWLAAAGFALLIVVALLTVRNARNRRPPFALCALLSWILFSGIMVSVPEAMADRFMLGPTWFLALPLGAAISRWSHDSRFKLALVAVLLLVQASVSSYKSLQWRSTDSLLRHAVETCPNSVHNHFRYAELLSDEGKAEEAVWHFAVAATGRNSFPNRWEHPAAEAECSVPVRRRLAMMHELLHAPGTEAQWRAGFASYLTATSHYPEARLVIETSPVPMTAPAVPKKEDVNGELAGASGLGL
jgi:hypothetical protein